MSFLSQPLSLFSIGPTRSFSGIKGYVTISENTVDKLTITKQPVQQGANIADHAFKEPVSISIQMLFADNLFQSLSDVYQKLLALQQPQVPAPAITDFNGIQPSSSIPTFTPFSVVTPKRTYTNMMLATLGQTTDKKTENCLSINATFEEVIIVPVTTANVPRSRLKNAGSNGGTQSVGTKQSAAYTGAQAVGLAK